MERDAKVKITVRVPSLLLKRAREATGQGITETVRRGLESLAASKVYQELLKMRGKYRFSLDLKELREDRR
jgi:hypothetical protein